MVGEIAAANRPPAPPTSTPAPAGNIPSGTAQTPLNLAVVSPAQAAVGSTFQVTVQASNAHDLFGVPLQLQFDPKVVALVNVDAGELLGRDGQAVALTHRDDGQGAVSVNLERPPQTKGIDGQGALCVLTFKAIAPGSSQLALVRVGARDSRQQNMPALGSQANVRVTAAGSGPGSSH
jgi:general secretion pathway protein D